MSDRPSAPPRPGSVTVAAIALIVVVAVEVLIILTAAGSRPSPGAMLFVADPLLGAPIVNRGIIIGSFVYASTIAALLLFFAVFTLRGRNWARVAITVLLGLSLLWNVVIAGPPEVLSVVLPVGVLLLYWLGPANGYFDHSSKPGRRPTRI